MRRYTLDIANREFVVDVQETDFDQFEVTVGGESYVVTLSEDQAVGGTIAAAPAAAPAPAPKAAPAAAPAAAAPAAAPADVPKAKTVLSTLRTAGVWRTTGLADSVVGMAGVCDGVAPLCKARSSVSSVWASCA